MPVVKLEDARTHRAMHAHATRHAHGGVKCNKCIRLCISLFANKYVKKLNTQAKEETQQEKNGQSVNLLPNQATRKSITQTVHQCTD